jgi:Domain of unknown function (DUF4389)
VTTYSPYSAYPSRERELPFQVGPPPVLVAVADRAPQNRVTVLFRLLMVIPHGIVLFFLTIALEVVAFIGWWGALFMGRLPEFAHTFLSGVLRWYIRVYAYAMLLTDAYPRFSLDDDLGYPVRVAVPPAQRLNRAAVFFRFILMIPVGIMNYVLVYGGLTLMAIVAWLITLVTGQLPESFHLAYSAVLRFQARYYGYALMLTPAYPGQLFGDVPGTHTWADAAPAAPVPPGFGSPESVYGGPTVQDSPAFPAAPAAPADPAGYGYPLPAQPGYGYPVSAQPGYGYPVPAGPVSWLVVLSAAARRLMIVFIVLGAIFYVGVAAYDATVFSHRASQANNFATAQNALNSVNASYDTLTKNLTSWESAVQACDGNLTCVTGQDAKAAGFFTTFDNQLTATAMPSNSVAAANRLDQVGNSSAQAFTQLSKVTTASQYQSVVTSTNLQTTLNNFDTDYTALVNALESN